MRTLKDFPLHPGYDASDCAHCKFFVDLLNEHIAYWGCGERYFSNVLEALKGLKG